MAPETLYRRLQEHLDRTPIGYPATENGVEIRILKQLFTPEEAELALEVSALPETARTIHRRVRSRMTLEELVGRLDDMTAKGLILRLPRGNEPRYLKQNFAIGIYEWQLKRLTPELGRDTQEYLHGAFRHAFHKRKTTQMRTVPVHKTIAIERSVATYEDIRQYVERSEGPFAKATCICRHAKDLLGEKCRQTDIRESCMTIGPAARMTVERGAARLISRDEMLALLEEADSEGLVLQPENTKNPLFVCSCCGCCCGVLTSAKEFERPADYFSANFYAEVDGQVCQACGTCETRCQMGAIQTENGAAAVDLARCIGCGLCVTTCPSGAVRLKEREARKVPPNDTGALYMKILQERYGPLRTATIAGKWLLGRKV
jgi:formate hydrogenlyase subunit 6/NADH:ubiquinone oxidoreductase subunit I